MSKNNYSFEYSKYVFYYSICEKNSKSSRICNVNMQCNYYLNNCEVIGYMSIPFRKYLWHLRFMHIYRILKVH